MQPQQGQMAQGFSEPQAMQATMMGGQHVLTVPVQSPAPTWMGVIMILWGIGMGLLGLSGLFAEDGMGEGLYLVNQLVGILTTLAIGGAGFMVFRRKKIGVWVGLGACALNLAMGVIVALAIGDEVGGALGEFLGGLYLIGPVICNSFCALMIAIPLMATGSNLE
ncbi:MAG: hypothetical protein CMB37_00310 [Euryarchaeota archaeon]|nr:hypothetical protein [Euryarchaeota archaeon]MED5487022.1 hypothetical protein [Candidatus Thermoplasmatota archaeon]